MQGVKQLIKQYGSQIIYRRQLKKDEFEAMRTKALQSDGNPLSAASSDLFTYHGEDGMLQFILHHLKDIPPVFIDIGAGDCIKSNCATLAVHKAWSGVFVDADERQLAIGKSFYKRLNKNGLQFFNCYVNPSNINSLFDEAGIAPAIGVLSIDVDGNDYWIWQAIETIRPKVVVIEAKVEFGERSVTVPFSPQNHHSFDALYNGASVEALRKLGLKKGYTLIGANAQGYNLFFIPSHLVKPPFFAAETSMLLSNKDTQKSFYKEQFFKEHNFISI